MMRRVCVAGSLPNSPHCICEGMIRGVCRCNGHTFMGRFDVEDDATDMATRDPEVAAVPGVAGGTIIRTSENKAREALYWRTVDVEGGCTRFEVARVALEQGLPEVKPSQAYSFVLEHGAGVLPGGVSVVETNDDFVRLAVVQSNKELLSLRLYHDGNTLESILEQHEGEASPLENLYDSAVSGCDGMIITSSEDGHMRMFKLAPESDARAGSAKKEWQQVDLINKYIFGMGSLGLGALKKMVSGRAAEAADRAMCTFSMPLLTGAGGAESRMQEHFVFVLQADFVLRVVRIDSDDKAHHDTLHSVAEHIGLADTEPKDDLTETPHMIHCIPIVQDTGDSMGPKPAPCVLVCLTLALNAGPVVVVLKVDMGVEDTVAGEHAVSLVRTYHGLPDNVVDVKVTEDYVWALCTDDTQHKAAKLLYSAVTQPDGALGWCTAAVDQAIGSAVVEVGPHDMPEACYAEAIFDRGTFSTRTLQYTLGFETDNPQLREMTTAELRKEAVNVLSMTAAADGAVGGAGGAPATQRDRQIQVWKSYMNDCIISWHKERAPRGLFVDHGVVFIVTDSGLEHVRMCMPKSLEELSLPGSAIPAELDGKLLDSSNQIPNEDFRYLLEAVALIRSVTGQKLPAGLIANPQGQTREEVDVLLEEEPDAVDAICAKLTAIRNLPRAAERLLTLVNSGFDDDDDDDDGTGNNTTTSIQLAHPWSRLFRGRAGNASLVSELEHQIKDRVLVCRGLLQLTDIATRRCAQVNIEGEDSAKIKSESQPQTAALLRQFGTLLWASSHRSSADGTSVLLVPFVDKHRTQVKFKFSDASFARLDKWTLDEWSHLQSSLVAALLKHLADEKSLPLFLLETRQFEKVKEYCALQSNAGHKGPLAYLLGLAYLEAHEFQKAKSTFLAAGATIGANQESDDLMRAFFYHNIQGVVGSGGVPTEDGWKAAAKAKSEAKPLTRVAFFTKIATLFESKIPHRLTGGKHETLQRFSAPQMVIHFAREAINGLDSAAAASAGTAAAGGAGAGMDVDPFAEASKARDDARDELQRLRSMLIKHLLLLGQHDAAMTFVVSLPRRESADTDAQKKFLHLVIKQLCERGDFQTIVENSYATCGLESEVVEVLKLKAIHTHIQIQLEEKNFFMVLFSFHVRRGNFKDASWWMFVLAVKIREHIRMDLDAQRVFANREERRRLCDKLQAMSDAYASSVSTLQLVSKDHQWHTEPRRTTAAVSTGSSSTEHSSKRSRTGGSRPARSLAGGVDVVTLAALKRELLLARSELELARHGGQPPANGAAMFAELGGGVEEAVRGTIQRLVDISLFDSAMSLSIAYKPTFASVDQPPPEEDIFLALVDKCVLATDDDGESGAAEEAGGWLGRNDLNPMAGGVGGVDGSDVYVVDPNLQGFSGAAWEFLRRFLERHDSKPGNNYAFHRCVADRILSFASSSDGGGGDPDAAEHVRLPVWLVENFKKRHGAALLDLYINHKQYDDAIALVHGFVDDFETTEKKKKAQDSYIQSKWLPYAAIKRLEAELTTLVPSRARDIDFVHKY